MILRVVRQGEAFTRIVLYHSAIRVNSIFWCIRHARFSTWRIQFILCHAQIFLWHIQNRTWRIQNCIWRIRNIPPLVGGGFE